MDGSAVDGAAGDPSGLDLLALTRLKKKCTRRPGVFLTATFTDGLPGGDALARQFLPACLAFVHHQGSGLGFNRMRACTGCPSGRGFDAIQAHTLALAHVRFADFWRHAARL